MHIHTKVGDDLLFDQTDSPAASIFLRFFLPGFTIHLQRGCIAEITLTLTSQTLAVLIAACTRAYLCGSVQAIAWRPKSAG